MCPQTDYFVNQFAAQSGQVYDLGENDVVTATNPNADVGYGLALCFDLSVGADDGVKLPAASGDLAKFIGVSVLTQTNEQVYRGVGQSTYRAGKQIPAMRRGRVWVQVEEAVVKGDQAFVRFAAGAGGTQLGAFRKSADTATAAALKNGVYFTSSQLGRDGVSLYAVVELANPTTAST